MLSVVNHGKAFENNQNVININWFYVRADKQYISHINNNAV